MAVKKAAKKAAAKPTQAPVAAEEPKKAKFGCAKSPNFYMSPDFDEPLEDFKEYM